ncbi:MAG: TauD/TfdA family dioxygenase [Symploca sp. SIO2B6]|nr:TauD/TfdA family dioxygenase [Symploca sp. SIO2B6]
MVSVSDTAKLDFINCLNLEDIEHKIFDIYEQIEREGFVIIQAWDASKETFKGIAEFFGHIQNHPNADELGVIKVKPERKKKAEAYERFISKTSGNFWPHTDGVYLDGFCVLNDQVVRVKPPTFVMLQCVRPAQEGGVSTLVDTQKIFEKLWVQSPELMKIAIQPRTISHCAEKHFSSYSPLFEQLSEGRWRVRLRTDLMYIEPWAYSSVKHVIENYLHNPKVRKLHLLKEGQILIVDNYRMLHGRNEITFDVDDINKSRLLHKAWIWDASIDYLHSFRDVPPDPNSFKAFDMHHPLNINKPNKMPRPIKTGIYFQPKLEGLTYVQHQ